MTESIVKIQEQLLHQHMGETTPARSQTMVSMDGLDWKAYHLKLARLSAVSSMQALYAAVLELLVEVCGAESAVFLINDPDSCEFIVSALHGDTESAHLLGLRLPRQEFLTQASFIQSEPIMVGDVHTDPRWLKIVNPSYAARITNLISVPLIANEKLLGVILVYNYTFVNLDYIEILQMHIAHEMERQASFESVLDRNQRLTKLVNALGQIGGTLDRKLILQTILEQSAAMVNAERTSIYLNTPGTSSTSFQLAYQPDADLTNDSPSDIQKKMHGFMGTNRSVITVPLRAGSDVDSSKNEANFMGGLMVVKPSKDSFTNEETSVLKTLVQHASTYLQAAEIFEGLEELFFDVIGAMVASMDAKDTYTQGHSKRVSEYSVLIAQELGLDTQEVNNVRIGSLLHDVGKIGIPDEILKKKGKLTPEEYTVIQNHPLTGWKILREVRLLEPMLPAIIEHHEKLNGSGYPFGLHANEISLMGRIVAVADVFDAMTSDRPYRAAIPIPEVLTYLNDNANSLFDADCIEALKKIISRSMVYNS
jgi:putative nucleotidyltransferase with HDIG domain